MNKIVITPREKMNAHAPYKDLVTELTRRASTVKGNYRETVSEIHEIFTEDMDKLISNVKETISKDSIAVGDELSRIINMTLDELEHLRILFNKYKNWLMTKTGMDETEFEEKKKLVVKKIRQVLNNAIKHKTSLGKVVEYLEEKLALHDPEVLIDLLEDFGEEAE